MPHALIIKTLQVPTFLPLCFLLNPSHTAQIKMLWLKIHCAARLLEKQNHEES